MSDAQYLTRMLEDNPDNEVIRWMLADELYASSGMTFSEAQRHVQVVAAAAAGARQIRAATELMADGSRSRAWLLMEIHRTCHIPREARPVVVITLGDQLRVLPERAPTQSLNYWGRCLVQAGASWMTMAWAARQIRQRERQRMYRQRRRHR
jgi:hypothetical protein